MWIVEIGLSNRSRQSLSAQLALGIKPEAETAIRFVFRAARALLEDPIGGLSPVGRGLGFNDGRPGAREPDRVRRADCRNAARGCARGLQFQLLDL